MTVTVPTFARPVSQLARLGWAVVATVAVRTSATLTLIPLAVKTVHRPVGTHLRWKARVDWCAA